LIATQGRRERGADKACSILIGSSTIFCAEAKLKKQKKKG